MDQYAAVHTILESEYPKLKVPSVTEVGHASGNDPYAVLVSTVISLRTKDTVTAEASARLLEQAPSLHDLAAMEEAVIGDLIYPAGFFRTKAARLRELARIIIEDHGGQVPDDLDTLLTLPGIGRKSANLILVEGFGIPAVCVDVHVHRILNRLGLISTKSPDETEAVLRRDLPQKYWISLNEMLVAWGQNVCRPVSPFCSSCQIEKHCDKVGVTKRR